MPGGICPGAYAPVGSKKDFFQLFFLKSRGHFEGSDFKPFVILARVPVDFKVVFGRLFFDIWKWSKMVENGSGVSFDRFLGRPEADLKGGSGGAVAPPAI